MDADAWIRNGARLATLFALLAFLAWIATLQPSYLLAALLAGLAAYALFLWDRRRHPVDLARFAGGTGEDRVLEGADEAISPGVSAGGIHLSFETRTRWRKR